MDYANYIKPELLVLIPVLIIIGKLIKDSTLTNDKHIPLILGVVSVIVSCGYIVIVIGEGVPQALVTGFIQGILLAGAAVYGNQVFKQYRKKDDE